MKSSPARPTPPGSSRRLLGLALLVLALAAVALAVLLARAPSEQDAADGPRAVSRQARSLLVVTVDTTRADRLGVYGGDVETPVIDRLGAQGVVFEQASAVAPITLVAHTSIFTGLYPPQHGVRNNGLHFVGDETRTLAETLRDAGWRTGAFVSAAVLETRYGLDQGFEVYDDDLSAGRERHPRMVPDRPAEATVASARAWLDEVGTDERFFAWVHLYDPHAPYSPPPPYRDTYRERLYDGEIASMDAQIGHLLEHPRLRGEDELAVVVLGDHGESLGEHGEQTHAILAYEATLHVPFVLHVRPGPTGVRVAAPVSQVDLVPTLHELLGLDAAPPSESLGRSLLPLIESPHAPHPALPIYAETYLPYYTYGWAKLRTLRRGAMKYIDAPRPELYDLGRDPRELTDLHAERPHAAHDLRRDLDELLAVAGDSEREASLDLDSESVAKLRSLGYLAVGSRPAPADGERTDPKDAIDLHVGLERARTLLRDRLVEPAQRQLRMVLERDPNNLAALVDLASALELGGEVDEAVRVVERALSIEPDQPNLHLQLAGLEARRGAPERAIDLADLALELQPRLVEAQLQKVVFLLQARRADAARALLESILRGDPGQPRALALAARHIDAADGNLEAAETRLLAALGHDPHLILGWRLLGEVRERRGDVAGAASAYRDGLERRPDDPQLHQRLGLLLARAGAAAASPARSPPPDARAATDGGRGNVGTDAAMHLREAIRLSPTFRPELHVALGGWLAEHGRLEAAEAEYAKVLERDPGHPGARNNRAIALYRTGRADEARRLLEELVAEHPRHADAHNNLAALAVERGDWSDAARHARAALALDDSQAEGWNNLGVALDELGRRGEAEDAYRRALERDPSYWRARFNLAVVLAQSDPRAAVDELEAVLAQVPNFPEAHLHLARLFAGPLDDPARARRHDNAFLRVAPPNHPARAEARKRAAEAVP
ncbi:MAG: tetratricopeptide repeat protein [Acidobacteriota bacterium]